MNENEHVDIKGDEGNPLVAILMATYQGQKYVREQIKSILNQTFPHWVLIISDDGSTDGTQDAVSEFSNDNRIITIKRGNGARGAVSNFSELLTWAINHTSASVFMFCDQDDIWLADKVEVSVSNIKCIEAEVSNDVPVLVHGDMEVVDESLRQISPSYYTYQGVRVHTPPKIQTLLIQNTITGCTAAFNRVLADLASPIPEDAIWHDWWVGLLAACAGQSRYLPRVLVQYRQTGNNTIGAVKYSVLSEYAVMSSYKMSNDRNMFLLRAESQACSILKRLDERGTLLPAAVRKIVGSFSAYYTWPKYQRLCIWLRFRYGRSGALGAVKFIIRSMAIPMHR